jgi:hypothetical protein
VRRVEGNEGRGSESQGDPQMDVEQGRLEEARTKEVPWRKWGPYLSERQWGTVREDYSDNGDAWNFFTHDHARSRAYRWARTAWAGCPTTGSTSTEGVCGRTVRDLAARVSSGPQAFNNTPPSRRACRRSNVTVVAPTVR